MALATRCPACGTIFRISTVQAAAKSGMVRCGVCRHVFNSLDALVRVEDLEPEPEAPVEYDPPAHGAGEPSDVPLAEADIPAATVKEAAFAIEPETDTNRIAAPGDAAPENAPPHIGADRPDLDSQQAKSPAAVEPTFMRGAARRARSAAERAVLGIVSLVAALALVAQAAYVWRDELAARWPVVKPALLAACVPLRCVVSLPARLDAIRIVSSSLQNTPGRRDAYVATVLLRNYAQVALQLPAIELTLTDTQDRPLVRRVFLSRDYLKRESGAPSSAVADGIAADSELPVRIVFEAAGLRVAGFYFERFYP